MKPAVTFMLLVAPLLAFAGIDKPWQEDNTGQGSMSGGALIFGALGAGFFVVQGLKNNESLGSIFIGAVLGFSFGSIIGLPIGCMMR